MRTSREPPITERFGRSMRPAFHFVSSPKNSGCRINACTRSWVIRRRLRRSGDAGWPGRWVPQRSSLSCLELSPCRAFLRPTPRSADCLPLPWMSWQKAVRGALTTSTTACRWLVPHRRSSFRRVLGSRSLSDQGTLSTRYGFRSFGGSRTSSQAERTASCSIRQPPARTRDAMLSSPDSHTRSPSSRSESCRSLSSSVG